jgi:hypothetical protein
MSNQTTTMTTCCPSAPWGVATALVIGMSLQKKWLETFQAALRVGAEQGEHKTRPLKIK